MATKVAKVGIKKEKGYLYFVDKKGDISCAKMARGAKKGGSPKKVAKVGIKKGTNGYKDSNQLMAALTPNNSEFLPQGNVPMQQTPAASDCVLTRSAGTQSDDDSMNLLSLRIRKQRERYVASGVCKDPVGMLLQPPFGAS